MRLLLIARERRTIDGIKNFSGVWAFYLAREFRRMGVELVYDAPLHNAGLSTERLLDHYRRLDFGGIDHVLALGNRYFTRVNPGCAAILKERLNGAVTQIHDTPVAHAGVDCTFTLCEGKPREAEKSHLVGWAADPEMCFPQQDARTLGILVDHPDYVEGRGDRSDEILESARSFIASGLWWEKFDAVKLWRIADGGIIEHDGGKAGTYQRKAIPFTEACGYYSQAHLFMVTHPESVGLTVLEAAMSGALPIVPKGYIPKDRLKTVRHLTYSDEIPWAQALQSINPAASRKKAMANTWDRIAENIVNWLEGFQK